MTGGRIRHRSTAKSGKARATFVTVALLGICLWVAAVLVLSRSTNDTGCVSTRDLGTVVSGDHNDATIVVSRGSVVTLRLGSAYNVSTTAYPQSSNLRVLRPVPFCADATLVSSLPGSITSFRAVAAGQANIDLYPEGSSSFGGPRSTFRVRVVVASFDERAWIILAAVIGAACALTYWLLVKSQKKVKMPSGSSTKPEP